MCSSPVWPRSERRSPWEEHPITFEAQRWVGGWDAWNVTEDADLGFRLARFGCRAAALDSDTFEEAPIPLRAWFKQRCRWQKGWLQTFLVHSRAPRRLFREMG
jgi:glycosyltransferase XagB